MENVSRRSVLRAVATAAVAVGAAKPSCAAESNEPKAPHLWPLEGVLKIHPKYLFKYYINGFGDGQACALFGDEKLKNVKPGSTIHVEGRLGTRFHDGGNEKNLSPFPRTWFIYMDVESVTVLRAPEEKLPEPGAKADKTAEGPR